MIVAVAGGKGGVGKSTVAYNLAPELDAIAVDADLGMADLPAGHGPDLHDVLAGHANPLEAVDESGPVKLLPCGRTLAGARAVDVMELSETIERVESAYGTVVVDVPAGMAADAGFCLSVADAAVLVTTPAASAVADAIRTRELASQFETGLCGAVLNKTEETVQTGAFRRALGAPVLTLPQSGAIATAQRNGLPVRTVDSCCPAAARFRSLAETVAAVE